MGEVPLFLWARYPCSYERGTPVLMGEVPLYTACMEAVAFTTVWPERVCVCVYVSMYVCVCARVCVRERVCDTPTHTRQVLSARTREGASVCVCMCVCVCVCMCVNPPRRGILLLVRKELEERQLNCRIFFVHLG